MLAIVLLRTGNEKTTAKLKFPMRNTKAYQVFNGVSDSYKCGFIREERGQCLLQNKLNYWQAKLLACGTKKLNYSKLQSNYP